MRLWPRRIRDPQRLTGADIREMGIAMASGIKVAVNHKVTYEPKAPPHMLTVRYFARDGGLIYTALLRRSGSGSTYHDTMGTNVEALIQRGLYRMEITGDI